MKFNFSKATNSCPLGIYEQLIMFVCFTGFMPLTFPTMFSDTKMQVFNPYNPSENIVISRDKNNANVEILSKFIEGVVKNYTDINRKSAEVYIANYPSFDWENCYDLDYEDDRKNLTYCKTHCLDWHDYFARVNAVDKFFDDDNF